MCFFFFEKTAPLLDRDSSLFCISSWNDNGYGDMDLDAGRLMRTGFFPGLGWILKMLTYADVSIFKMLTYADVC
jgi:alpha-1,3-mannosyl-glycoprotein beta-1,2-N-acetylglucosaminyltransferase